MCIIQENFQMKTLITGATGFIGMHLVRSLVEEGKEVKCLIRETSDRNKLEKLGVELVYGDLLDKGSLKEALKEVSIIYHLGGEVYSFRVRDYYRINVEGTRNLLETCLSYNIEKFIHFSSIAAAGPNHDNKKFHSEGDLCSPITPYGQSKLEAERIVKDFSKNYGLATIILRLPVIYGPGQSKDVSQLFEMAQKGRFIFFGNGENVKSACYIKNLICGIALLEHYDHSGNDVFYIADDNPYTLNEIVQTVAEKKGVSLSCLHLSKFIADILWALYKFFTALGISFMSLYVPKSISLNFGCDISKIKEKLLYKPIVQFDDAIEETLIWLSKSNSSNK